MVRAQDVAFALQDVARLCKVEWIGGGQMIRRDDADQRAADVVNQAGGELFPRNPRPRVLFSRVPSMPVRTA